MSYRKLESTAKTTRMRNVLKSSKPGDYKWAKQVNLMTPEQLRAVYLNLRQSRSLNNN